MNGVGSGEWGMVSGEWGVGSGKRKFPTRVSVSSSGLTQNHEKTYSLLFERLRQRHSFRLTRSVRAAHTAFAQRMPPGL